MSALKTIPAKVGKLIGFPIEYAQDMWQFFRHNGHSPLAPKNERLFYHAVIQTHTIEKGLALAKPRPLFGKDKIRGVISALKRYDTAASDFPVGMANGALQDYWSNNRQYEDPQSLLIEVEKAFSGSAVAPTGGVKIVSSEDWKDLETAEAFLTSRTSCRMFETAPLDREVIEHAVRLAQAAPSQCNRQATKAHFFQDRNQIESLLRLQGGSAGFSDAVGNLFVITSDVMAWGGPQQRNQLYVDGGLFSMTLMLALHGLGLASCPLNLAVTNGREREIKRVGGIPANERVIMMLAVGHGAADERKAAKSPRRPVEEILNFHNSVSSGG